MTRPPCKVSSKAVVFVFIVALVGFADASYLTVEHYRNVIPPCTTSGCETVLSSAYSTVLGFPVSLGGTIYYLAIAVGSLVYLEAKHLSGDLRAHHLAILKWILLATVLGFLASAWFFYLQAFVIHSFCQYCLGSALTSTVLFVTAIEVFRRDSREDAGNKLEQGAREQAERGHKEQMGTKNYE